MSKLQFYCVTNFTYCMIFSGFGLSHGDSIQGYINKCLKAYYQSGGVGGVRVEFTIGSPVTCLLTRNRIENAQVLRQLEVPWIGRKMNASGMIG